MSKILRAKFVCTQITDFGYGSKQAKLSAVYSNNKDEDNQFSSATPSGNMEMMISAEGAKDFFEPGKKYYLDFQIAPEE